MPPVSAKASSLSDLTGPEKLSHFGLSVSLAFFLGLLAACYSLTWAGMIIPALGPGWLLQMALISVLFMAWGLGAFYWGRQVEGEASAAPYTGAALLAIAAPLAQSPLFILEPLGLLTNRLAPFWVNLLPGPFGGCLLVALLSCSLSFFFLGGVWSLLAETSISRPRHFDRGLAWLWGANLAGLVAGAAGWRLAAPLGFFYLSLLAGGLNLIGVLANLALGRKSLAYGLGAGLPRLALRPRSVWGVWHGQTSYGASVDVPPLAAKLSSAALFLGAMALGAHLAGFASVAERLESGSLASINGWWLSGGLALLAGALAARGLGKILGPVSGLALLFFVLALVCRLAAVPAEEHLKRLGDDWRLKLSAAWLMPLALAGALLPFAAQMVQGRRRWVASSLGLALWRLALGFSLGLLVLGLGFRHWLGPQLTTFIITMASLAAVTLALANMLRGAALVLAGAAALGLAFYWWPGAGPASRTSLPEAGAKSSQTLLSETASARAALIVAFSRPDPQRARETLLINPEAGGRPETFYSLFSDRLTVLKPLPPGQIAAVYEWPRRNLANEDRLYDLIVIGPGASPYTAKGWPFYTREFYRQLSRRRDSGGTAALILPYNFLKPDDFKTVLATWLEVFPQTRAWDLAGEGLTLISGPGEPAWESISRLTDGGDNGRWALLTEKAGLIPNRETLRADSQELAERLRDWPGRNSDLKPQFWLKGQPLQPGPLWAVINSAWLEKAVGGSGGGYPGFPKTRAGPSGPGDR